MGEELRGARRHVQYDDQLRAGGCHVLLHASTTAGDTGHSETWGLMDWLPPILGFLIFVTPMDDEDKIWVEQWCAAKHAQAELRMEPIRLPWIEGTTIKAMQVICFAPRLDPQL